MKLEAAYDPPLATPAGAKAADPAGKPAAEPAKDTDRYVGGPGRGWRIAGWTTMGAGIVSLSLLPLVGLLPAAVLVPIASAMLNYGGAEPLD